MPPSRIGMGAKAALNHIGTSAILGARGTGGRWSSGGTMLTGLIALGGELLGIAVMTAVSTSFITTELRERRQERNRREAFDALRRQADEQGPDRRNPAHPGGAGPARP